MIERIDTNRVQDALDKLIPKQPVSTGPPQNQATDASLQVDFAAHIEKAKEIPTDDADALQQARELLESGRLESPQAFMQAAKQIVEFGI